MATVSIGSSKLHSPTRDVHGSMNERRDRRTPTNVAASGDNMSPKSERTYEVVYPSPHKQLRNPGHEYGTGR